MTRLSSFALICLLLALSPAIADTHDESPVKQAIALQQVVQNTIDSAEPSIVSVLVSRSEFYQKHGFDYSPYDPGKLGGYDVKRIDDWLQKKGLPREKRDEIIKQLDLADPDHVPEACGSGVAIGTKGFVLTPYHIVQGAAKILVRLPGGVSSYADIFAADPRSDLAVLRLHDSSIVLKTLTLGNVEQVKRGQFVVGLANPFVAGAKDHQPQASLGIVSKFWRATVKSATLKDWPKPAQHYGAFMQTDVRLPSGCSGGAILSLDGKLIGLTTVQSPQQGIDALGGLAIPIDATMRQIIDILARGEDVEYGFLGISFTSVAKPGKGVLLSNVLEGSPADQGGLRPGDTILSVNDQTINNADDMFAALGGLFAGNKVSLEVRKGGKKFGEMLTVILMKSFVAGKTIAANTRCPFFRGFRVDYGSLSVQCKFPGYNFDSIPRGVLVTEVQVNSPAATALLKPGEIITHVNNQLVETPQQFYERVRGWKGPVVLTLISLNGQAAPKVTIN
jgi:serine protease Do